MAIPEKHIKVSVIVPCYKQAQFLDDCLNSVLEQTDKNWECIIVNDGSPDNTEEIALKWTKKDSRFIYKFKENGGLSSARNTGIKISKGQFIQLLDCDDLIERNKNLSGLTFYETYFNYKNIIMYSSMRYFEDGSTGVLQILGRQNFIPHIDLTYTDTLASQRDLLKCRNPFVISAPLYPRRLFEEIGYFDENLTALEDWDFHIRCILNDFKFTHHAGKDDRTLIRLHDESMMRNDELLDNSYLNLIKKHQPKNINKSKWSLKSLIISFTPPILLHVAAKIFRIK